MAPLSFDEMVTGGRDVGNRGVECFCFKPEELPEKKASIDRDLARLILLAFLGGAQRQVGQMDHLFQRDHRDINE